MDSRDSKVTVNFIQAIIDQDKKTNKYGGKVHLRFPPEPNGYLHIGHAKSICLNFGIAAQNGGLCNLRFDDTNPSKEDVEYIDSIIKDVRWLGFDWEDRLFYASDYFEKMYDYAVGLIRAGEAYVCDLSPEEIRKYRGTFQEPGKESPYRKRSREENLNLFQGMRAGEFADGSRVLRAKIDMTSPNLNMRDPILYRILRATHHRTGDQWCIYPLYDYAHPLEDYYEGITHSICTLEFEDHRPLYDWVLNALHLPNPPRQIEFARLNLTNTVLSKRKLRQLVEEDYVTGWDDPRMPTISGLRRRGYTPESIRNFCDRIGISKTNSVVDIRFLEHCIREDLNLRAPRVMGVLHPLKLVISNYPEEMVEEMEAENNPEDPDAGTRQIPFSRNLYIEREDFCIDPPKKYFRLAPGFEVRLKNAYIIKCDGFVRDEKTGEIKEVHCSYDPETRSGRPASQRKIKGTLHWVSAAHALKAEVRLYDYLLLDQIEGGEEDEGDEDFVKQLNPNPLEVLSDCLVEPSLAGAAQGSRYQFMRQGYFYVDPDSLPDKLVFNLIVSLRDTWGKILKDNEDRKSYSQIP
ncbi:MAG: glutamine--tRNA ligase [Candidatus Infernicultor aquiphilus]|uniref:Glutamine--tRNA ligase n=1 Tax=Candidatus Infernicultor aquiphilus TaxID=1805029 RepID=A0A1J5GX93_9BACT|nr:MAG: glutamine--tRNA ligase [Candidatus Atribacteria bacterium CG2_30_33_13]PIU25422.1 MAG: glutamine--tRNA ligase [Candidatus Atribacteria bacterium CG08_land_8_20_14_0_20_33_29]PIW12408.1 MAG: glutamine--tRNA ligase [Candidatus Atribacteria bacterium CG17_big_fil_post_rev_8_21_14_2_50_34_11]PIX35367.1 MAG: glutamine--tRNA ligase [Candidatus Atribacteria bacterium CG_4_8_14_3_um_filter_34_18]PIY32814.1 MAG: glutamine--tRNA ligase [Candidatus Atribacteria bacterium CG_4_10_14_3_um_filter_34_